MKYLSAFLSSTTNIKLYAIGFFNITVEEYLYIKNDQIFMKCCCKLLNLPGNIGEWKSVFKH